MNTRTFGPGTATLFPSGVEMKCESLTITVNGVDITEGCEINLTRGCVTIPMTSVSIRKGEAEVVTSYRHVLKPKAKRKADWKVSRYGPNRRNP